MVKGLGKRCAAAVGVQFGPEEGQEGVPPMEAPGIGGGQVRQECHPLWLDDNGLHRPSVLTAEVHRPEEAKVEHGRNIRPPLTPREGSGPRGKSPGRAGEGRIAIVVPKRHDAAP